MYSKKDRKTESRPEKPLKNKRHELFCNVYAHELWGRPAEAAEKAGYKPSQKTIRDSCGNVLQTSPSPTMRGSGKISLILS